jgi:hypothetical protein
MATPNWLKPISVIVAVLVVALLIAAILSIPFQSAQAPSGYDQSRLHWNTKNATRFTGGGVAEVAARVSQAVYPAGDDTTRPDAAVLYDPDDWQGGLAAASLLRPLNAVLLPTGEGIEAELERLQPRGSEVLGGAGVLTMNAAEALGTGGAAQSIASDQVAEILEQAGAPPSHVIVADPTDPATALLAAPWLAFSGDLVVFDAADAPPGLPLFALGDVEAEGATRIGGANPDATAVAFAQYDDPDNPLFGWGMNDDSLTGYRAFTIARSDDPGMALLSANLARRGKPGPLLWTQERGLPQRTDNYLWSQRAAFWVTPAEGPFHHFWILGDPDWISFPAQGQADYAVEIGPYKVKGPGLAGIEMLAAVWSALGLASAAWVAFHEVRFLRGQQWVMRLAWPMLALVLGPVGILFYFLAYNRPVIRHGRMVMWDRPLWLQGLVATASAVGFGGPLMVATGYVLTQLGLPLIPATGPLFWLGSPMILVMIANYVVAVVISWLLFQTPMLAMFHGRSYTAMLPRALLIVVASMAAVSVLMFYSMCGLMMWNLPMMPTEEATMWFGIMFFTVFLGFLSAWPFNYVLVRKQVKSGMM